MSPVLDLVFDFVAFVTPVAIFIWGLRRWWRAPVRIESPRWRGYVAAIAACLAGLSIATWLTCFAWARNIGGFGFHDPTLMLFYAVGMLIAVLGLIASLVGKGKLCGPSFVVSGIFLLLWIVSALNE